MCYILLHVSHGSHVKPRSSLGTSLGTSGNIRELEAPQLEKKLETRCQVICRKFNIVDRVTFSASRNDRPTSFDQWPSEIRNDRKEPEVWKAPTSVTLPKVPALSEDAMLPEAWHLICVLFGGERFQLIGRCRWRSSPCYSNSVDMGWYGYIWVTMVGRLVFVLCFFFFCGEVLCSCFQENAWMRLPHIAVNGMTNCDSLGAAISCHQLPSAMSAIMCLLRPQVASRLCCSFCIWGMVEP
jgi:hypothetical protein